MEKGFATDLVGTLRESVLEIARSDPTRLEELLDTSLEQFGGALEKRFVDIAGPLPEVLAKGLNHVSAFASALNRINQTVQAIKAGRPSYMIDADSSMPEAAIDESIAEQLDRFIRAGVFTLRVMVNDTAELPETDAELQRAQRAGRLAKLDFGEDGGEVMLITDLPDAYLDFFASPLEMLKEAGEIGRDWTMVSAEVADALLDGGMEFPEALVKSLPQVFDLLLDEDDAATEATPVDLRATLLKKLPPPRRPAADPNAEDPEDMGGEADASGEDPEADDQGEGDEELDTSDDMPTDPLQVVIRLLSTGIVILGSIAQGGSAEGMPVDQEAGDQTDMDDNPGLRRSAPVFGAVPLAKILDGTIVVHDSVADALIEADKLRKQLPQIQAEKGQLVAEKDVLLEQLEKLKGKVKELEKTPAAGGGMAKVLTLSKSEDIAAGNGEGPDPEKETQRIAALAKIGDGDAAATELIKHVHGGGGRPYAPAIGTDA